MELWEEKGFTNEEAYTKFMSEQTAKHEEDSATNLGVALKKAEVEASAEKEAAVESAIAGAKVEAKAEAKKEFEQQEKVVTGDRETPEQREERFGGNVKSLEAKLSEADWDKIDGDLKTLSPELQDKVRNTKEGRYEFLMQFAEPSSEKETDSLRPKKEEPKESLKEQLAKALNKEPVKGRQSIKGSGFTPDNNIKKTKRNRKLSPSGSLCDDENL